MKQNTLANLRETKYIKNTCKGNFIILLFSILLNNNARLFNFIGQSFLLNRRYVLTNNTKIFDNSGEPEYIKNTRKGNLMTFDKLLKNFKQDCPIFRTVFFSKKYLTNNFLSIII